MTAIPIDRVKTLNTSIIDIVLAHGHSSAEALQF